jgi:hypothetical protein
MKPHNLWADGRCPTRSDAQRAARHKITTVACWRTQQPPRGQQADHPDSGMSLAVLGRLCAYASVCSGS